MNSSKEFSWAPGSEKKAWSLTKAATIGSLLNIDNDTYMPDVPISLLREPHPLFAGILDMLGEDYDKSPDFYDQMNADEYVKHNRIKAIYRHKLHGIDQSITSLDELIKSGEAGVKEGRLPHLSKYLMGIVQFGILDEELDEYGIYEGVPGHNGERLVDWDKLEQEDSFNKSPHQIVDLQLAALNNYRAQFVARKQELKSALIDIERKREDTSQA
jgi:hypothetical protein